MQCHQKIFEYGGQPSDDWLINLSGQSVSVMKNKCPCITRSHCGANGYYSTARGRKLRLAELMRLQGFDDQRLVCPPTVSERQARLMVGNAFCVQVIAAVLDRLLYAIGKTDKPLTFVHGKGGDVEGNA